MRNIYRRDYSMALKEAVENYLKARKVEYTLEEKEGNFKFPWDTGTKLGVVNYWIMIYKEGVMLYAFLPFGEQVYTKEEREELLNFIISASYGELGCWTMDLRGDYGSAIAYRMYCEWGEKTPDESFFPWLDKHLKQCLIPFENFLPGFEDIIFHGSSCKMAMHGCLMKMFKEGREC